MQVILNVAVTNEDIQESAKYEIANRHAISCTRSLGCPVARAMNREIAKTPELAGYYASVGVGNCNVFSDDENHPLFLSCEMPKELANLAADYDTHLNGLIGTIGFGGPLPTGPVSGTLVFESYAD